ncbi:MAG: hypothetical protein ACI8RZ_004646 [Myxococcota bacterium]
MSTRANIHAAALLLVYGFLLQVSAPGLTSLGAKGLHEKHWNEAIRLGVPVPLVDVVDLVSQSG